MFVTTDVGRDTGAERTGERERAIGKDPFGFAWGGFFTMEEELIFARMVIAGVPTELKGAVPGARLLRETSVRARTFTRWSLKSF